METSTSISYPEKLHEIFVENIGENGRVTPFETSVIVLIEQMITEERIKGQKEIRKEKEIAKNDIKKEHIKSDIKISCESCSRYDLVIGCDLKNAICIQDDKYTRYKRVHLLHCDRCKTYSVVTMLDKIVDNNGNIVKPIIKFICLKCNNSPLINGRSFKGYELRGVRFTSRYLKRHKEKIKVDSQITVQEPEIISELKDEEKYIKIKEEINIEENRSEMEIIA